MGSISKLIHVPKRRILCHFRNVRCHFRANISLNYICPDYKSLYWSYGCWDIAGNTSLNRQTMDGAGLGLCGSSLGQLR